MIPITPRFKGAIRLANGVSLERLPQFLERIVIKLMEVVQQQRPFSDEEEKKLQQVLGMSAEELQALIDSCLYTYERAAAESSSSSDVTDLLQTAGVASDQLAAFQQVWETHGTDLIRAAKERSLGAPGHSQIRDVKWRVHLKVADSQDGHLLDPKGILQLKMGAPGEVVETSSVALEFSYEELSDFYEKLEVIQDQLDSLSS